jgi:hypothetical protein
VNEELFVVVKPTNVKDTLKGGQKSLWDSCCVLEAQIVWDSDGVALQNRNILEQVKTRTNPYVH